MIEKYSPREPISFERKIDELLDAKKKISKKRELLKKNFSEAIDQDRDTPELYREYCAQSEKYKEKMDKYDAEIDFLKSEKERINSMPIYSKMPEYQDEQLQGDMVYEYLKGKNDEESLKAMRERKMPFDQYKMLFDQYMTVLYTELEGQSESKENFIKIFMEKFKSGLAVLDVKVGQKGNGRGMKTINEKGNLETEIGEEYILTRLSRYFMKTQKVTLDDLKKSIKFPEGVKITKPEDTKIKFECGDMKGTIKVKFNMSDLEVVPQNVENPNQSDDSLHGNNSESSTESGEQFPEKEASPKQLFISLEQYIKNRIGVDLAKANRGDIEAAFELLKNEEGYKEFCEWAKGEEVLDKPEIKFPHSFKDFLDEIAPIELDEERLIAILQSNYKRKKGDGGVLVFGVKCFKNYREYPELEGKYQKRNDYIKHYSELNESQKEEFENLKMEIHKIEGKIIDTYYPHLREVYFKDQMSH